MKPFRESQRRRRVHAAADLQPRRSVLTRWADWLEAVRGEYSLPAMSVLGTMGCLPGRTIAIRMGILRAAMPEFLSGQVPRHLP